jgi:hypothetical protein
MTNKFGSYGRFQMSHHKLLTKCMLLFVMNSVLFLSAVVFKSNCRRNKKPNLVEYEQRVNNVKLPCSRN